MKIDFLKEGKCMRWIMGKETEMERPEYRFCQCCGEKVGREEKICPACKRLTVRNLKTIGTAELLAEDSETCLCVLERHQKSRIAFEQVTEEQETGCAAGTGI